MNSKYLKIIWKIIYFTFTAFIVLVAALTLASLLGIPKQLKVFVVETGSMSPAIPAGSILFVTPQDDYSIGDVITFDSVNNDGQNVVVTHRLHDEKTENGETVFQTKGDANNAPDGSLVFPRDVQGKSILSLPLVGYVVGFAKTKLGFVLLIVIPTVMIIYSEVLNIKKEFQKMAKKKKSNLNENLS